MSKKRGTLTNFGKEVRIKIIEKGIKQRELAKELGMSETFLCGILYGTRPGKDYVCKIAAVLEIDQSKYAL